MNATLMHKNVPVIELELDDTTGVITRLGDFYDLRHIPVGVSGADNTPDRLALNKWWTGRAIPASRMGIREALEVMRVDFTEILLTKCLGLSLSDQYWVCPKNSDFKWADINFFENPFSDDVGNALFGIETNHVAMSLMSPDNTSDGWLKKKWIIADGKRCLVKGGSNPFHQEPLNEIFASAVMRRLNIPHIPYSLIWDKGFPYSSCEDFITTDTELVSAWRIMQTQPKIPEISKYQHYINCCAALGITGTVDNLNQMLSVDYLISNEDRHFNNFGVIRNAETLEWIDFAPIFDCGTSMWFDHNTFVIGQNDISKPFEKTHSEQIALVKSYDFLDFEKIADIADMCYEIYKSSPFIDDERLKWLCHWTGRRMELLKGIAPGCTQRYGITMQ